VTQVNLSTGAAEDVLRILTGFSAVLRNSLPERLYDVLEPAIGPEIIRHGYPMGALYLADKVDELRVTLRDSLGIHEDEE
jgi:hypothetical protein